MRILLALVVIVVFVALLVFDTTALVRLTVVCVTGGCGVPVVWIAIGSGVLVLAALLSFRRPSANVKKARVMKRGRSAVKRGKAPARKKPKPAK
jgi:hypothetical protein